MESTRTTENTLLQQGGRASEKRLQISIKRHEGVRFHTNKN